MRGRDDRSNPGQATFRWFNGRHGDQCTAGECADASSARDVCSRTPPFLRGDHAAQIIQGKSTRIMYERRSGDHVCWKRCSIGNAHRHRVFVNGKLKAIDQFDDCPSRRTPSSCRQQCGDIGRTDSDRQPVTWRQRNHPVRTAPKGVDCPIAVRTATIVHGTVRPLEVSDRAPQREGARTQSVGNAAGRGRARSGTAHSDQGTKG